MEGYPRHLTPDFKPFDPVRLAEQTEKIVCRLGSEGVERKYTAFYVTGVYGGIATGYTVGCCLRCFFCWVDASREYPERCGEFHSPRDAFEKLRRAAHKHGVSKIRISGAEPTIGKEHLLPLLRYVEESEFPLFILETNGILLGQDIGYVRRLADFSKVHIRVSLKAGSPEGFTTRTGALPDRFELPYRAVRNLLEQGVDFHVASMSDPRLMPTGEREALIRRLRSIDPKTATNLEEEVVDPYDTTLFRMKAAGVDPARFFSKKPAR